jgi:sugar lactone lactonase YvrE
MCAHAAAPPSTSTSLSIVANGAAASSVPAGTAVTLTATVLGGTSNISPGQVQFCDVTIIPKCTVNNILATAQLNSTGVATFKTVRAPGIYAYQAFFVGTHLFAASTSATKPLQVGSGVSPTTTTLAYAGLTGATTLSATVTGASPHALTGSVITSAPGSTAGTYSFGRKTVTPAFNHSASFQNFSFVTSNAIVEDLDGDGIPDYVDIYENTTYVSNPNILYSFHGPLFNKGEGSGSFSLITTGPINSSLFYGTTTPSLGKMSLVSGDFNADGTPDILIASSARSEADFAVSGPPSTGAYPSNTLPQPIYPGPSYGGVAADVDGDGNEDLVLMNVGTDLSLSILLGNGDYTFKPAYKLQLPELANSVAIGDFNQDGVPDILVQGATGLSVLLGTGNGTFAAPVQVYAFPADVYTAGTPPVLGDFNNDGILDIATVNAVLLSYGDGTFLTRYVAGFFPKAAGYYDGDTTLDLLVGATVSPNLEAVFGHGDGTFTTSPHQATTGDPLIYGILSTDLNGDGIADVVTGTSDNYGAASPQAFVAKLTSTATAMLPGNTVSGTVVSYLGDQYFGPSSGTFTTPATLVPTTTTVALPQKVSGTQFQLTATLSPYNSSIFSSDGELISFYKGSMLLGQGMLQSGVATATVTLPSGTYAVQAQFGGDAWFAPSAGSVNAAVNGVGIITTVAGTRGFFSPTQDGGPATSAALTGPRQVALDGAGNLYIADVGDQRIRRVDAVTGIITTVAGTGVAGYVASQDGGPAIAAELSSPNGIAVDAAGNLYIGDTGNQRIRKVTAATGVITTIAGTGVAGYVATQDGGPAMTAELNSPAGVALDSFGNLYIADAVNRRVRKVDAKTGIITTVAGAGTASTPSTTFGGQAKATYLTSPLGVAVDASGNLYIADSLYVEQVSADTGIITAVAGNGSYGYVAAQDGGPATAAELDYATAVALDSAGNVYIADSGNNRVRKVSMFSGAIDTIAGTNGGGYLVNQDGGPATSAYLNAPEGVAVDASGNVYIGDTANGRVRKVTYGPTLQSPVITWSPASLVYGTGLGAAQLNATTTVAGSFSYNPVAGTVLPGGTQTLLTTFTPADPTMYTSPTVSAQVQVTQAAPVVTFNPPASVPYGTTVGGPLLSATASVAGTFVYTPAVGTPLNTGSYGIKAVFSPTDTVDYSSVTTVAQVTVAPQGSDAGNLLPNSGDPAGAGWINGGIASISPNSTVAPDGLSTAAVITAGSPDSDLTVRVPNPASYDGMLMTGSVWLRVPSGTQTIDLFLIDITNGGFGIASWQQAVVTTTWQKFYIHGLNGQGLTDLSFQIGGANSLIGGQTLYVWDPELQAVNAPGVSLNNFLPNSQRMTAANWMPGNGTAADNASSAPDGTMTASTFTATQQDATLTGHASSLPVLSGVAVTGSIWLRAHSGTPTVGLYLIGRNSAGLSYTGVGSETLSTTWQRFSVTGTTAANLGDLWLQIGGGGSLPAGQVIDIWGGQIEVGSKLSPYLPTLTTPAISATDYANILPSSAALSGPGWATNQVGVTYGIAAPDNTNTAVSWTGSGTDNYVTNDVAFPALYDGVQVTGSVYLRSPSSTFEPVYLMAVAPGPSGTTAPYTYQLSVQGIQLTSTWQKITLPATQVVPNGTTRLYIQVGGGVTHTGSDIVQMWGMRLVQGSHPDPVTY